MKSRDLKHNAKLSLKGNYGKSILLMVLQTLTTSILILILNIIYPIILSKLEITLSNETNNLILSIGYSIITSLFFFGNLSFYLKLSRNEKVSCTELFTKTNMFLSYIFITILTTIFTYLWSILFIIPGIIAAYSYQLVFYVKLDGPNMGTLDVIRESKDLMRGNKFRLFILQLSFIGWILIGILTLGIGFLWIIPYMQVTFANFYNSLLPERDFSMKLENAQRNNFDIHSRNAIQHNYSNTINQKTIQNNNMKQETNNIEPPSWNIQNPSTNINNNFSNNNGQ